MFLLIDGSSMLVTSYYGNLPKSILFAKTEEEKEAHYNEILHNSKGVYTNAVYTMLRTLLKIIKEQKPDYIAVAFDKSRDTFRKQMYSEYKGNRKTTPQPLKQQFILMEELLSKLGLQVLVSDDYEADDLVGSIIKKFEGPDMPMYFVTKDHDYIQLIDEYTRGWFVQTSQDNANALKKKYWSKYGIDEKKVNIPDKTFEFTAGLIEQEYGHTPIQIIDVKAIGGDSSDNIPGVRGVSDTTAIALLKEYGTIEEIYAAIDACENEKEEKELAKFWKENLSVSRSPIKPLKENREMAFLSKKLATIKTDLTISQSLDDFTCRINEDVLKEYCKELEFKSLI